MQLIQRLARYFSGRATLPETGNADTNRMARLLWQIVWITMIITLAMLVMAFTQTGYFWEIISLYLFALFFQVMVLELLHRGRVRLGVHIMLSVMWFSLSIMIWFGRGVNSDHILGLVLLIILAVWMTSGRVALVYLGLASLSLLAVQVIAEQGYSLPQIFIANLAPSWVNQVLYLILILLILQALRLVYQETLSNSRLLERRHRSLLSSISDSVLVLNFHLGVISANQQVADLLGYTPISMMSLKLSDLMPPDEAALFQTMVAQLVAGEAPPMFESTMIAFSGSTLDVQISCGVVEDEFGQPGMIQIVIRDITERNLLENQLKRSLSELDQLARTDPLTGIMNRRSLSDLGDQLVVHHPEDLCVVLIDVDKLKRINDDHGHMGGDSALIYFARCLQDAMYEGDYCGRWAGDEFLALLTATTLSEAAARMGALHECTQTQPLLLEKDSVLVHVSMGIVCSGQVSDSTDLVSLVKYADEALYKAKAAGRNRIINYEPSP